MRKQIVGLAMLAFLAACGSKEDAANLTSEESARLNEADAMLDGNLDQVAVSEDAAANSSEELSANGD